MHFMYTVLCTAKSVIVSRCSTVGTVENGHEAAVHLRKHSSTAIGRKGTYMERMASFPGSAPQRLS